MKLVSLGGGTSVVSVGALGDLEAVDRPIVRNEGSGCKFSTVEPVDVDTMVTGVARTA